MFMGKETREYICIKWIFNNIINLCKGKLWWRHAINSIKKLTNAKFFQYDIISYFSRISIRLILIKTRNPFVRPRQDTQAILTVNFQNDLTLCTPFSLHLTTSTHTLCKTEKFHSKLLAELFATHLFLVCFLLFLFAQGSHSHLS